MAIYKDGKTLFVGAVLQIYSHMWMDGMEEETAVVWNDETGEIERRTVGYYGSDGCNLAGMSAEVDATDETKWAVRRSLKSDAYRAFCKSVIRYKASVHKGDRAVVVRGRKVPKGSVLSVFWIGERPTFRSRQCPWMHETETVAGCHDEQGNKVWILVDYLAPVDTPKSPNAKERRRFLKDYIDREARSVGA